jgi:hypothetical protein
MSKIHLGLGLELETLDTDYAKTMTIKNNLARMDLDILFKIKKEKKQ